MNSAHDHAPSTFGRSFAIGIALNVGFVLIETLYGWRSGSLALLADAAHNLSDVGGLILAWAGLAWPPPSCAQITDTPTVGSAAQSWPALGMQ